MGPLGGPLRCCWKVVWKVVASIVFWRPLSGIDQLLDLRGHLRGHLRGAKSGASEGGSEGRAAGGEQASGAKGPPALEVRRGQLRRGGAGGKRV